MFQAQQLEAELVRLIWATRLYAETAAADLERLIMELDQWTMGKLKTALADAPIDGRLRHRLETALKQRNRLAHMYFRPRTDARLLTPGGRRRMIDELRNTASYLDRVAQALWPITERELKKKGIPIEQLTAKTERLLDELIAKSEENWS